MDNCNNPNAPFNVRIVIPEGTTQPVQNEVEVRGIPPIKVTKQMEGLKTVYIVSYSPLVGPTCKITVSPASVEIGIPTQVTFTLTSTKGSAEIVSRVVSPNADVVNNQFTKDLTLMNPGNQASHTYTVTDEEGQVCTSSAAVNAKYRFYTGTIPRNDDSLDTSTIQSFTSNLGSSIGQAFTQREYTMDQEQGHFVWIYPADFSSIPTPTGDGNFPFGLTVLPGEWVINGITYKGAKTSTSFVNGGSATLKF